MKSTLDRWLSGLGERGRQEFQIVAHRAAIAGSPDPFGAAMRSLQARQGRQFRTGTGRARNSHTERRDAAQGTAIHLLTVAQAIDAAKNAETGKERRAAKKLLHDRFLR